MLLGSISSVQACEAKADANRINLTAHGLLQTPWFEYKEFRKTFKKLTTNKTHQ